MNRVGLVVELSGRQDAMAGLHQLKAAADEINKKRISLQIDAATVDKQIATIKRVIASMQRTKARIQIDGGDTSKINSQINDLKEKLDELTKQKADIQVAAKVEMTGLQAAKQELQDLKENAYSVRDALSTLGSGLSTIGGTLQSIGSRFGGNVLSTMATTLTAYSTLLATQGLSSSVSRYDTFKTFPALMEQVGYSSNDAQNAINKMNDAVLGLPTGLNEIVESSKQYILALNDIDKGTDLAIAANNAFLANASDSAQVYQGMRQIQDILSKGELRSMEWMSLFAALGTSIQPIAEQMGYGADAVAQFKTELQDGTIDAMDFIDALIEVGNGTGALVERANIQKETLNATLTNIKNAFSITGQAILQEMDTLFERYTGKSLPENIKKISDFIKNEIKPAITGWMDANGDRIMGFFTRLKEFDWMKLFSSIGNAIDTLVTSVGKLVDLVPEDFLSGFITFATVWASPIGKAFSIVASGINTLVSALNGLSALWGGAASTGLGGALGALGSIAGPFAAVLGASKAINSWSEAKEAEVVDSLTTDAQAKNQTSFRQAKMAANEARRNLAALKKEYDSLEMYEGYDDDGQLVKKHRDPIYARELANAIKQEEQNVADLNARYRELKEASVSESVDNITDSLEDQGEVVRDLKGEYEKLRDSIKESLESSMTAFQTQTAGEMAADELAKQTADNKKATEAYIEDLKTLRDYQQELSRAGTLRDESGNIIQEGSFDSAIAELYESGNRDMLNAVANAIRENRTDLLASILSDYDWFGEGQDAAADYGAGFIMEAQGIDVFEEGGFKELIDSEGFEEVTGQIEDAISSLEGLEFSDLGAESIDLVKDRITELQDALDGIDGAEGFMERLNSLQEGLADATGEDGGLEAISQTVKNLVEDISGLNDIDLSDFSETMTALQESFMPEEGESPFQDMAQSLTDMKDALSGMSEIDTASITDQITPIFEALSSAGGEDGGIATMGESMQTIVSSLTQLGEVDLSGAMGGVEDLTGALPGLTSALDETAGAADGASASANAAESSISNLANTATSRAGAFDSLIGSMGSLSGAFSGAAASANALAAAINAIPSSKTVTVNYQQTGSVSPIGPAKGGYITPDYKAVGGVINWEPMGTDTIPAMLTPGEFVVKKKAVDKFRPILEKINNMDLTGAMDALFSGFTTPKAYGNIYNTYNKDFHGTVNQYMNNAGRNYTERRAYRFMNAI